MSDFGVARKRTGRKHPPGQLVLLPGFDSDEPPQIPASPPFPADVQRLYRRIKDLGAEAQQVRDRLFVDRPETGQGYQDQARRNMVAAMRYFQVWEMAEAFGVGDKVAELIERDWQLRDKIRYFPRCPM